MARLVIDHVNLRAYSYRGSQAVLALIRPELGECRHYAGCERWVEFTPWPWGRDVGADGEVCNGEQELLGITGTQYPFSAPVTQTRSKNFERLFDRAYSVIYIPSG